ncbi:MAG: helix-hairpin-helix domain-containing protein [Pseudomonadota bacterium]
MSPEFAEYLPLIVGGIVGALVAIFVVSRMNRRAKVVSDDNATDTKDVLDEGAARASRNQALIDSAPSADPTPAAPPAPEPAPVPAPSPTPAPEPVLSGAGDDLTKIKGLGPKLATLLGEQGINSFAQIAAWNDSDVERVDATLGRFAGRITRDNWIEQAKLLEKGDESGFSEKFGQNG